MSARARALVARNEGFGASARLYPLWVAIPLREG